MKKSIIGIVLVGLLGAVVGTGLSVAPVLGQTELQPVSSCIQGCQNAWGTNGSNPNPTREAACETSCNQGTTCGAQGVSGCTGCCNSYCQTTYPTDPILQGDCKSNCTSVCPVAVPATPIPAPIATPSGC